MPMSRPCVENRAVDMSVNPYLAAALSLAAGLEGIREELDQVDGASAGIGVGGVQGLVQLAPRLDAVANVVAPVGVVVDLADPTGAP